MNYLAIGHVTKDILPDGYMLSGPVCYAGIVASTLGHKVHVLTSYGDDLAGMVNSRFRRWHGIEIENVEATGNSTTFDNKYHPDGVRTQKWLATAEELYSANIPTHWPNPDIIHLAPVAQEFLPNIIRYLQKQYPLPANRLLCANIQGWLRGKNYETHDVIFRMANDLLTFVAGIDILVLSLSDCGGDADLCQTLLKMPRIAGIETLGSRGCMVHPGLGIPYFIPTVSLEEVDGARGAGDIFATSLFCRYAGTRDIADAAAFANTLAGLSVTVKGLEQQRGVIRNYIGDLT